jgi:hypothetical protein
MRKKLLSSSASFIILTLSSLSLIASTSLPGELVNLSTFDNTIDDDSLSFYPDTENAEEDNTLFDSTDAIVKASDEDLNPPFEEAVPNIEDQDKSASTPALKPDLQKTLYDPTMNYGKGAPVPKPTPASTLTRNLIVLGTSTVLATIAMLVVSTNPGRDAPKR